MKLKNFQSNFQRCCQKIQKLKPCYTKKLKLLECTANYLNNFEYITSKSKLDQLYIQKANRIRIKMLLVYGEKSTSYFLNFEISAQQKSISNILKNGKEITDQKEVNNKMFDFYNNLLKSDKKDLSMTLFNF